MPLLIKRKKREIDPKYQNPDGSFKGGFDGAVRYFMNVKGYSKETATKIAGKIAAEKGKFRKSAWTTKYIDSLPGSASENIAASAKAWSKKDLLDMLGDLPKGKKAKKSMAVMVTSDGRLWVSLKKSTPNGDRWVTIKEGHLKGRHILLDKKGYIVGGSVPRAFQGHHITKLKGIGTGENPFTDFSQEELKEIHRDFTSGHQKQKEEYRGMIDEIAQQLHMEHEMNYGSPSSIANRVREIGGIQPPRKGVDAYGSEYHESISPSIRSVIGNKTGGLPLDEAADELGMSVSELIQALAGTKHKGNLRADHFYAEAERALDRIHGEQNMASRRESIEFMEKEIAKLEAAMRRKDREDVKSPKKLAASFIDRAGRLLVKSKLSPHLKAMVRAGGAHWVTVKEGPLKGRHLLIDGPRPALGKQSRGKILAGHGIPPHVVEKITGATHAHHLEHEQSEGPKEKEKVKTEGPFTERDASRYNNTTHFPTTAEKLNQQHADQTKSDRDKVKAQLNRYGVDEIPADVEDALKRLANSHEHFTREQIRAKEVAPPWTVTGRANYKGRPDKADAIRRNASEKLEAAKNNLNRVMNRYSHDRISSDESDAIQQLQTKIDKAVAFQERMKQVNKIVKNPKMTIDQKEQKLIEAGFSTENAKKLAPTSGAESWQLQNNLANIKRMKERVKQLNQQRSDSTSENEFEGGKILDNVDDNRVQIFFDNKPDEELRTKLKSRGFKWAPSVGAWQRMRSAEALKIAKDITSDKVKKTFVASDGRLLIKRVR